MKNWKKKIKSPLIFRSLFVRVYFYFGVMLSLTAVMIGIIFMKLYEQNSIQSYRNEIEQEIRDVVERTEEFIKNDEDNEIVGSYQEVLEVLLQGDIYILSNPDADTPMPTRFANVKDNDNLIKSDFEDILQQVFDGEQVYEINYMKTYRSKVLILGEPVHGQTGKVVGAVLIRYYLTQQQEIIDRGLRMIVISVVAALLIAMVLSVIFARNISVPISSIRTAAVELTEGNYEFRTKLERHDEIGELADSVNVLAGRLGEIEQERQNMEQMRLDFFANVSHELRTPITVMRGYTETLRDGVVVDPERVNHYYDRMVKECQSMERLVGDLLLLSKMQNPDFSIDAEPIEIVSLFHDMIRNARVLAGEKQIEVEYYHNEDTILMMGDYERLNQMFMVIIDNAVKFSGEHSKIYVRLELKPGKEGSFGTIAVSIRDEGVGISREELPYIFEKFYKSKLRQNKKGTGLGLMIARQIALKHGGTIQAESEVGKGTEFLFEFEAIDPESL
jgi:signal transduction histidine kinase